ncbi:hypothetical protein SAY87_013369 [Trapa incisa]|uniref:DUF220 domain-containing protein n=2 Tax=Trapa TaxID=22665 RepID=A0AAN7K977_TRANT|nr:hypothetical protein SAY86_008287 [Trapa natans]KAK4763931.1 hypothetical protein SAY87_013369 [Trapa incisa]
MRDTELPKTRIEMGRKNKSPPRKVFDHPLFTQLPHKLQNFVKLKIFRKNNERISLPGFFPTKEKVMSTSDFDVNLEKQLQAWKENPIWMDETPHIKVTVPKGSLCNLKVKVDIGLPPDAVYNIVTDPDNKRVFKNIKEVISRKVLVDEGLRQVVDVEQAALWKFLWWSGTLSVHVLVDQNRAEHSMRFKQVKTGFMKRFEGFWTVEPLFVDEHLCSPHKPTTWEDYNLCTRGKGRIGSRVSLDQLIQPALVPPPPISWYARGITTMTTEMLIHDLAAEAARIRGDFNCLRSVDGEKSRSEENVDDSVDKTRTIKERWVMRRKNAKLGNQRLSAAK